MVGTSKAKTYGIVDEVIIKRRLLWRLRLTFSRLLRPICLVFGHKDPFFVRYRNNWTDEDQFAGPWCGRCGYKT